MSFVNKAEILELAASLNKHRIDLVHRLTSRQTVDDVVSQAKEMKEIYEQLFMTTKNITRRAMNYDNPYARRRSSHQRTAGASICHRLS